VRERRLQLVDEGRDRALVDRFAREVREAGRPAARVVDDQRRRGRADVETGPWDASLGGGEPPLGTGEPPTRAEADGATEAEADGAIDGEATTTAVGTTDGDGVGRRPTGSGPTRTNAARMPAAASTPTSRPAMIARADFMGREGTSTDGPKADRSGRW
jgi:hypothetical protein